MVNGNQKRIKLRFRQISLSLQFPDILQELQYHNRGYGLTDFLLCPGLRQQRRQNRQTAHISPLHSQSDLQADRQERPQAHNPPRTHRHDALMPRI